jgi:PAS domain S-box-containing protein
VPTSRISARELEGGAGSVIVAEEAVATADVRGLEGWMTAQPAWSDLPLILLTRRGDAPARNPAAQRLQDLLGNVNFLERPFHPTTLVSMVRSGLRARRRQYQARALLEDLRAGEERLRLFIEQAPAALAMLDRDMRYVAVSRRWMLDFKLSRLADRPRSLRSVPGNSRGVEIAHQRCLSGAVVTTEADRLERADGTLLWLKRDVRPWRDNRGNIGGLVVSWEDVTAAKEADENQKLLTRELQHRTKNLMAVIQSIAMGTFRPATRGWRHFGRGCMRLAEAQNFLTEANWGGAYLEDIVGRELASFAGRISIDGPRVLLRSNAVQGFTLVVHELATNAAKHGALRAPNGRISVRWSVEGNGAEPALRFRWEERGGPPANPPRDKGFGSVLLEHAVPTADDPPRFDYGPAGFTYELEAAHAISSQQGEPHPRTA